MDELRARLARAGVGDDRTRLRTTCSGMPIDRVFTVAGTGTVVTGTASRASIETGRLREAAARGPRGARTVDRVARASLERSTPGTRTAVALSGVERKEIARGDVLVLAADPWEATTRLDAELTLSREAGVALLDRSVCGCTMAPPR